MDVGFTGAGAADQDQIVGKALWSGDFLQIVLLPKPALVAKSAQSAFRRNAGAGKDENVLHGVIDRKWKVRTMRYGLKTSPPTDAAGYPRSA